MKRIYILFSLLVAIGAAEAIAQTASEAYLHSLSDPSGTARNLGSGNSMFAIGPDLSAISSNPAGIGGFWKSEFAVSIGGEFNSYSSYLSTDPTSVSGGKNNYATFPNAGFVLTSRPRNSQLVTSNWAFGYNRMSEYRQEINYAGSTVGSITDAWRENALGLTSTELNGFEEGLAYTSGAIYDFEEDRIYESDYQLSPNYRLMKQENTTIEGGKSELYFGYGANISNKFMIGLSFNIPIVNSTEYRNYSEQDGIENGVPFFNNLNYTKFVNSSGSGVNGKFGVTFKPNKQVNIAFAAHTPTKLFLTDNYSTTVTYDYSDGMNNGPIYSYSPYGTFQYAVVTPWSLMGGIGIIAGEHGFIGASVKWTDYSSMRYDYSVKGNYYYYDREEQAVNSEIKSNYASSFDINMGGELVLNEYRLRGGVSLLQSAYSNDSSFDPSYHAGIGYRADVFYIDFGYKWTKQDIGYLPYETNDSTQPLVLTETIVSTIVGTVGLKF